MGMGGRKVLEAMLPALKIAALAYAGFCLFIFLRQSSYVYYPRRDVAAAPDAVGLRFEDVRLKTPDGETVAGWFVPAEEGVPDPKTLLHFHGNAGNNGDRLDGIRAFHDLGVNVLIVDYHGFGRSTGKPSEKGTYLDARAAWDFLTKEKRIPPARIVVLGRSLGGAVASWLAEAVNPGALVLESSFTSARDMAARIFPMAPRWLCRFRYDTLARMPRLKCPVLVAHGPRDEIIPYAHGRRLFAAAREPKIFVELQRDHNAGEVDLEPKYRAALLRFIAAAGTGPTIPSPLGGEGQGQGRR